MRDMPGSRHQTLSETHAACSDAFTGLLDLGCILHFDRNCLLRVMCKCSLSTERTHPPQKSALLPLWSRLHHILLLRNRSDARISLMQ